MLGAGRQIVNAMYLLIDLYLVRDIATIELIAVVGFIDLGFPLLPPQVTIAALLTVGIPRSSWSAGRRRGGLRSPRYGASLPRRWRWEAPSD